MFTFTRRALLSVVSIFSPAEHSSFLSLFFSALGTVTDNLVLYVPFGVSHRFSCESVKLVSAMALKKYIQFSAWKIPREKPGALFIYRIVEMSVSFPASGNVTIRKVVFYLSDFPETFCKW